MKQKYQVEIEGDEKEMNRDFSKEIKYLLDEIGILVGGSLKVKKIE